MRYALSMKFHFFLQFRLLNRKLRDSGVRPLVGYLFTLLLFVALAEYAFYRTELAHYLLSAAALLVLIRTAQTDRNEFLLIAYGTSAFRKIRVLENFVISIPFLVELFCHKYFLTAAILLAVALLIAPFSFRTRFNFPIPTPFYRKPFEFAVGFRNTYYLLLAAYGLSLVALSVNNVNLALVSMLLLFLISLTYYLKPEEDYVVWSHATKPAAFLFAKLKIASTYGMLLVLPMVLLLLFSYPTFGLRILLFVLIGFAFLWTIVLAKYAAYPNEINVPEGILIAICAPFPPLLLILIPLFYNRSVKNLNTLLT